MGEWRRGGWWFPALAAIALLLLGAIDNTALMLAVAALLSVVGLIALPGQRARGGAAVIVGACVALAIAAVLRWSRG